MKPVSYDGKDFPALARGCLASGEAFQFTLSGLALEQARPRLTDGGFDPKFIGLIRAGSEMSKLLLILTVARAKRRRVSAVDRGDSILVTVEAPE
ncbi:MAG: hypothetical protein IPJ34_13115 [Myxococcales bacterium]|nr:hypothetical protein [Myxococcales bacterium]